MTETKKLTPEEKWNQATIADNFIFYKVMRHNQDICKELLEILLEMEIDRIEMQGEEFIQIDAEHHAVRLDVYAKNSTQAFDIEIQTTDTRELPERARYYQGMIDVDSLKSGQKYKNLKTSYIIFICIDDIFNMGLGKYTFQNICLENSKISLNDRTFKYFFIAKNYDKLLNKNQKAFLKLMLGRPAKGKFADKITRLVEQAKHNEQWRHTYMTIEDLENAAYDRGVEQGIKQGMEHGAECSKLENAKNALSLGLSIEQVKAITGLSEEEIEKLQKSESKCDE